ncbi:MAG: hypothetical protein L3K08_04390 [Thermoplasmata archaeon]|nr:hypothetical protein [Thermoplasmata archaeon]
MQNIGQLPLGVAILAVLIGIFGAVILVVGLLVLLAIAGLALSGVVVTSVFGATGVVAGLIIVIVGAVILAVATGLWDQELWALVLAILVLLFYGAAEFFSGNWFGLAIVGLLLVYLVAVSRHFD